MRGKLCRFHEGLVLKYGVRRVWVWWLLLALVVLLPVFLYEGTGPWDGEVFKKITKKAKVDRQAYSTLEAWWQCWWQPGEATESGGWKWKRLHPWMYGVLGRWWGGVLAWVGFVFLLLTTRFWLPNSSQKENSVVSQTRIPLWCKLGFVVALVAALPARLPCMNHSCEHDEIYAGQEYILGDWKTNKETQQLFFQPKDWEATFSGDRLVNNHMLMSVLSRSCLEVWRFVTGSESQQWQEWPLRIPSLLAGLATIVLGGVILAQRGRPVAGLLFALILALHPWHVYWSTVARGYGLCLFFLVLALYFVLSALERGGLWRWIAFGLAEAAVLLTYPPTVYVILLLNLVLLAALGMQKKQLRQKVEQFWSFVVGNLLGALVTIVFLFPHVPQFRAYFDREGGGWFSMGRMGEHWWADLHSHLFLGQRMKSPDEITISAAERGGDLPAVNLQIEHFSSSRADLLEKWGISSGLINGVVAFLLLLFLLGLWRAWRKKWYEALLLLTPALGSYLCWLVTEWMDGYLWTWYLLPILLSVIWFVVLGMEYLIQVPRWRFVTAPLMGILFLAWAVAGHDQRSMQAKHDRMPLRDAVSYVRGHAPVTEVVNVEKNRALITLGTASGRVASYDPTVIRLGRQKNNLDANGNSRTDLNALANEELALGKEVYVLFCAPHLFVREYPLPWQQLQSNSWQLVAEFPGTEIQYSYHLYRYQKID